MGKGAEIYFIIHAILIVTCIIPEVFSYRVHSKMKSWIMFVWSLFFTIFAGIRWQNGTDWYQYLFHFQSCSLDNIFNHYRSVGGEGKLEWLFVLLNAIVNKLTGSFWVYNTLTAGIIQFTQFYVIKKLCPTRPLLLYCLLMVNDTSYFAVRSQLSSGIGLWCYLCYKYYCEYGRFHKVNLMHIGGLWKYFKESKIVHYLVSWYSAYSIHHQSVVLLPMILAGKVKINTYAYMIGSVILIIVLFISTSSLNFISSLKSYIGSFSTLVGGDVGDKAVHYTEFVTDGGGSGKSISSIIIYLAFAVVFLIVRKRERLVKDEWYNAMLNLYLVWCAIYIVCSGIMNDLVRLTYQFNFARLLLMVAAFESFYRFKNIWIKVLIWIVFVAYIISRYTQLDSWYFFYMANVPYKTIFSL